MTILTTHNAESFGYKPQAGVSGGAPSVGNGLSSKNMGPATDNTVAPSESIGSSVNYVQGMQNESRTQTFAQGANEGKSPSGDGAGGVVSKIKGMLGGGGEAEAGAGAGVAEDAAVVAL